MVPATVPKIIPPEIQITTTGRKNNGLNKWKLIKSTGANILTVSTRNIITATFTKIIPPEIQITTTRRKNNGLNKWKLIKSTGANILPVSTRKFITCVSNSSIATLLDYNDDQNH